MPLVFSFIFLVTIGYCLALALPKAYAPCHANRFDENAGLPQTCHSCAYLLKNEEWRAKKSKKITKSLDFFQNICQIFMLFEEIEYWCDFWFYLSAEIRNNYQNEWLLET